MKKHQSAFHFVFAVYIIAGIFAIVLFYKDGSHLSHLIDQQQIIAEKEPEDTLFTQDTEPASKDVNVVGIVETPDETVSEAESTTESDETVVTEPLNTDEAVVTEPEDTDETVVSEPDDTDEAVISESDDTDEVVISESGDTNEAVTEPDDTDRSDDEADDAEPEKIYYGFTVKSNRSNVRVRKSSERNSSIVGHVNGGDTGYVIEENDKRTKIVLKDGTVGYIYNEYISVSEIPKEDVPKEYR